MSYTELFETTQRGDETIIVLKEGNDKIKDLIRKIHFDLFDGCLPNDWIYKVVSEAFDELETTDIDDITIEGDCYYHDLHAWSGEPYAPNFINEAMQEGLAAGDFHNQIACGQYLAKRAIYFAVAEFLRAKEEGDE